MCVTLKGLNINPCPPAVGCTIFADPWMVSDNFHLENELHALHEQGFKAVLLPSLSKCGIFVTLDVLVTKHWKPESIVLDFSEGWRREWDNIIILCYTSPISLMEPVTLRFSLEKYPTAWNFNMYATFNLESHLVILISTTRICYFKVSEGSVSLGLLMCWYSRHPGPKPVRFVFYKEFFKALLGYFKVEQYKLWFRENRSRKELEMPSSLQLHIV